MQNKLASGARLGRQALLFPLCLVLYEFSTYIGNDMIQPGMLAVVEQYQAGIDWVPTSMTAYLAGGMFLQWLTKAGTVCIPGTVFTTIRI